MFHATQQGDEPEAHNRIPGLHRTLIKTTVPATTCPDHLVADGGSLGVGHSVWLRPAGGICAPAVNETELSVWALERVAAQFLPGGGELGVCHGPGPARTDLDVIATDWAPEWMNTANIHHSAERIHGLDAALVIADPCDHEQPIDMDTAVSFFRVLRRAVLPGGVVLVHTHQAGGPNGMLDPTGPHVRAARHAGLGYLQHHVIVHTRLLTEPLGAADPAPRNPPRHAAPAPRHRRVHSDLIALHVH